MADLQISNLPVEPFSLHWKQKADLWHGLEMLQTLWVAFGILMQYPMLQFTFKQSRFFCPCRDSAITTMSLTGPASPLEQLLQHKDDSFQVHLFITKDLRSLAALNKSFKSHAMDNEHYQDMHRDYGHEQWLAWMNSPSNPYDFSD